MSEEKNVGLQVSKNELLNKFSEIRQEERLACLKEIELICAKYNFKLDAEIIISSKKTYANVFLVDIE